MKAALALPHATDELSRGAEPHPNARHSWPVTILGLPFDNASATAALTQIDTMVAAGRPYRVATATADVLFRARRDSYTRAALAAADMLLCDSRTLVCASLWLGNPLPERVRATNFAHALLRLCALRGFRVFVVDARPGGAARCAAALARATPNATIVGSYSPETEGGTDVEALRSLIRGSHADVLFERIDANGGPWLGPQHVELGAAVCVQCALKPHELDLIGRSASETLSLHFRRLMTRAGRVLRLLPELGRQWLCMSHRRGREVPAALVPASPEWLHLNAGSSLTREACDAAAAVWRLPEARRAHCAIDLSHVRHVDATGLAVLARCQLATERCGRQFVLIAPTEPVRSALADALLLPSFKVTSTFSEAEALAPPRSLVHTGVTRSLAWCGEIIAANVEDVWQMTSEYLRTFAASGATLVIIDLSRLRTVDVAGAALMVRVKQWSCTLRTEVLYAQVSAPVLGVLRACGVDRLLLEGAQ